MPLARVVAALVVPLAIALCAACGSGPSETATGPGSAVASSAGTVAPLSSTRVTQYPATMALRPGATPAGPGPIGQAIAAFTWCGPSPDCSVVLERVDGTQVTLGTDVGDTPLSLSPDGTWLVYLRQDATILRNLVTGAVQALPSYRTPLSWSPNSRWLLFAGGYGGDFVVRDTATGAEASHLHPSLAPTATAAPIEPVPRGRTTWPG